MVRGFLSGMLLILLLFSQLGMMTNWDFSNYSFLSKPFTYALSLDQLGAEVVQKYIGREPSGRTFNEIAVDYNGRDILTYLPFPQIFSIYTSQVSLTTLWSTVGLSCPLLFFSTWSSQNCLCPRSLNMSITSSPGWLVASLWDSRTQCFSQRKTLLTEIMLWLTSWGSGSVFQSKFSEFENYLRFN